MWSRDGRRLFFIEGQRLIAATVVTSPAFAVTTRDTVFEGDFEFNAGHPNYDVSPEGKEFFLLKPTGGSSETIVAYDWRYELRARMAGTTSK